MKTLEQAIRDMIKEYRRDYTGVMYNDYDDGVNRGVDRVCDALERLLEKRSYE